MVSQRQYPSHGGSSEKFINEEGVRLADSQVIHSPRKTSVTFRLLLCTQLGFPSHLQVLLSMLPSILVISLLRKAAIISIGILQPPLELGPIVYHVWQLWKQAQRGQATLCPKSMSLGSVRWYSKRNLSCFSGGVCSLAEEEGLMLIERLSDHTRSHRNTRANEVGSESCDLNVESQLVRCPGAKPYKLV